MLRLTVVIITTSLAASSLAADSISGGDYINNGAVQEALAKAIERGGGGQQILLSDIGKADVTVGVDFVKRDAELGIRSRDKTKQVASQHDNVTEIYHILEGSATLVTGGRIAGLHRQVNDPAIALNGPTMRGSIIEDGVSRDLGPGDVIVIPAGVPHWFSAVNQDLKFLIIRVDPDKVLRGK
jgi:mannose-6-phosphate isomerase-like protein (cupin superfamily)